MGQLCPHYSLLAEEWLPGKVAARAERMTRGNLTVSGMTIPTESLGAAKASYKASAIAEAETQLKAVQRFLGVR